MRDGPLRNFLLNNSVLNIPTIPTIIGIVGLIRTIKYLSDCCLSHRTLAPMFIIISLDLSFSQITIIRDRLTTDIYRFLLLAVLTSL